MLLFAQGKEIFLKLIFLTEMFSGKKGVVLVGLTVLAASSIFGYLSVYQHQITVHSPKTVDYVDLNRYVGRWY